MSFETDNWPKTGDDDVTRALPHALGPEKSALSTMLQDPVEYIGLALELGLTEAHFYLPCHAILFGFLLELNSAGIEIELVSLVQKLLDRGLLDRVGGPAALTDLYTYQPSSGHFRHHLKILKEKFVLRSLVQVSNTTIAAVYDAPDEAESTLDEAEKSILAIREGMTVVGAMTVAQAIDEVLEDFQRLLANEPRATGISTGFEDLDAKIFGMKPGEMFVVAARPAMGKSSFLMNVAEHISIDGGRPVMIFSLEMSTVQLTQRLIFSRAKFATSQVSRGYRPNKGDLQRIQRAALEIRQAPIFFDDEPNISISKLRAKARRMKREKDIQFIGIDYLQLIRSTSKQAASSREREIAEISSGIKGLAKELQLPIMILAQLNRGPESRSGKQKGVPRMSDLRESGAIEQDADQVGLLYRPAYYAEDQDERESLAGCAILDLAKNRSGEVGTVPLTWIADLTRFETGRPHQEEFPEVRY